MLPFESIPSIVSLVALVISLSSLRRNNVTFLRKRLSDTFTNTVILPPTTSPSAGDTITESDGCILSITKSPDIS